MPKLSPNYWQEVRDNCATILTGLPLERSWALWPVARVEHMRHAWLDSQGLLESLDWYRDRIGVLGKYAVYQDVTHEITTPGDEYPLLIRVDVAEEHILSAFPAPGHVLPMGWQGDGIEPKTYQQLHDAVARGAASRLPN